MPGAKGNVLALAGGGDIGHLPGRETEIVEQGVVAGAGQGQRVAAPDALGSPAQPVGPVTADVEQRGLDRAGAE